jgi:DoxX-like family
VLATFFSSISAVSLSALFGAGALLQFAGPRQLREAYEKWNYPRGFRQVTGALLMLAAIFLAFPLTRLWGVGLAALVMFLTTITLLNHRQYAWSVPVAVLFFALVPAALTGPI